MIRSLALTVSFFVAGAGPVLAQTHPPSHPQGRPHDPAGHTAPDPSQHAAMHALLLGSWKGTSSSNESVPKALDVTVATDKLGNVTLKMKTDQPVPFGAARHVAIEGGTLRWTQDVSGNACKATAVLSAATPLDPETMKGSMACEHDEITFTLQKTKG